ncbi:uncharacterized protein LOC123315935 [Coccinella septempunctata]|uniref:uncharacterized protein LOC123315935 n=1 Tax=Coccinella septempunctata TaxID=41139 RepID=UPI001D071682|nr:uncharacterized protein LOC123315935 [Coccinella septempunctata]
MLSQVIVILRAAGSCELAPFGTVQRISSTEDQVGEGEDGLAESLDRPTTSQQQQTHQDKRMRWTHVDNSTAIRAHFIAMRIAGGRGKTYMRTLNEIWNDMRPDRRTYAQHIANRVRWILDEEKLPRTELRTIERTCWPDRILREENTDISPVSDHREEQETAEDENVRGEDTDPQDQISVGFDRNLIKFSGMDPKSRQKIPRLKQNKKLMEDVRAVDKILSKLLRRDDTLIQVVDLVYAGAITVAELQGKTTSNNPERPSGDPPWKKRLERNINQHRSKLGIIQTYLSTQQPSRKVLRSMRVIARECKLRFTADDFRSKIKVTADNLKQKIKALGSRLRRYNERTKRYKNNRLYYANQKEFFRKLEGKMNTDGPPPTPEAVEGFWKGIWSEEVSHDGDADWLQEVVDQSRGEMMREIQIDVADIEWVLKSTNNWAAPGVDNIHNFWWKHFRSVHSSLARLFQKFLEKPELVPSFLTAGLTYMLPKGAESEDPKNYRPVTCLPTIYKLLTGVLTRHINNHVRSHNILATEQNGCKSKAMGAKELLITDVIITKHARKKLRNISVAWVDYKKAFDSVPHTWLLKVLSMYGVCGSVINLLKHLMSEWRTSLILRTGATIIKTADIAIRRGLFQGDTLSPLWFCLALNPLSMLINKQKYGYILDKNRKVKITHQLFIDDLKLYASNEEQLEKMLEIVATFSETIKMEMGLDKCARLTVKRGKIIENNSNILNPNAIQNLGRDETYKYLGIQQALEIKNAEMKEAFSKKLFYRVNQVLKSKLNSKSLFLALNTWALPIMTYTFGILTWSATELQALDTKIRTILTKYGVHHPHSSVARLYLQRHLGGRGMLNLETTHDKSVLKLREYFMKQNSPFVRTLRSVDVGCSPLRLSDSDFTQPIRTQQNLQEEWKAKVLHGRYPNNLENNNVNKKESLTYLKAGYLFPETEGRLLAIQDQVVPTRSYLKNIAGQQLTSDLCRKCKQGREHIQHVTSGCSILAPREYTDRHNQMAKVYHQAMALKLKLIKTKRKNHLYLPENVLENEEFKLYWDTTMVTDRPVANNRPDIVLLNKREKSCVIIDITVPSDDNISRAYTEKLTKYFDLSFELKEMYRLKKISIIPLVMSVNGLVEEHLVDNTKLLELDSYVVSSAQKEVILGTTRIVRRFLHSS